MIGPFTLTVVLCQVAAPAAPAAPAPTTATTAPATPASTAAPSAPAAPTAPKLQETQAAEGGQSLSAEPDGRAKRRKPKPQPASPGHPAASPGPMGSPLVPPGFALPPLGAAAALAFGKASGLVLPVLALPVGGAAAAAGAAGGAAGGVVLPAPLAGAGGAAGGAVVPLAGAAGAAAGAAGVAGAAAGVAGAAAGVAGERPTLRLRFLASRPPETTDIRLDGRRWVPKDWDAARKVSVGRHRLSVETPAGAHFEHVDDARSGEVVVEIPGLGEPTDGPVPLPVWIAAGGTGAALVATTILGLVALDKRDTYETANGKLGQTRAGLNSLHDDAKLWEVLTDVSLGLTVAGAATTAALYYLWPREHAPAAALAPLPGGGLFVFGGAL